MPNKFMLITLLFTLAATVSCNNNDMKSHGMMGMMGSPNILAEAPSLEKNDPYIKGYQYAESTCSQCHAMPNPNLHTSSQWPRVIERMKKNINKFNKNMPDNDVLEAIVDYYVGNSK